MIKKFFKYLYFGIAWGCTYFVVLCMIADLADWDLFLQDTFDRYALHALGAMIVGIGFGTTSIVYSFNRLRNWQKTLIHFSIGMGIYLAVGLHLNWLPYDSGPAIISVILGSILLFFIISFIFYMFQKEETKKINERIQEIGKKDRD